MNATHTSRRRATGARALDWWRQYCDPADGDAGVRARLRRCRGTTDALGVPAAIDLARRLGAATGERGTVALDLARVLAHVTEDTPRVRPMQSAGWKSFPTKSTPDADRPRLSEIRFRRLISAQRGDELVVAFTRLAALLGGKMNVSDLAEDFWWWNDRTRQRWAFDYYAAGVAAPADAGIDDSGADDADLSPADLPASETAV